MDVCDRQSARTYGLFLRLMFSKTENKTDNVAKETFKQIMFKYYS